MSNTGMIGRQAHIDDQSLLDAEYALARLEGQLARWEATLAPGYSPFDAWGEQQVILKDAKQFLASVRLAIDPRRIYVV